MMTKTRTQAAMIAVGLGLLVIPANAQSASGATCSDGLNLHRRLQYLMMKEMTLGMSQTTEQMSQDQMTADRRKQMAERMSHMSKMMHHVGPCPRPAHTHAALQRQMDEMARNSQMAPGAKLFSTTTS